MPFIHQSIPFTGRSFVPPGTLRPPHPSDRAPRRWCMDPHNLTVLVAFGPLAGTDVHRFHLVWRQHLFRVDARRDRLPGSRRGGPGGPILRRPNVRWVVCALNMPETVPLGCQLIELYHAIENALRGHECIDIPEGPNIMLVEFALNAQHMQARIDARAAVTRQARQQALERLEQDPWLIGPLTPPKAGPGIPMTPAPRPVEARWKSLDDLAARVLSPEEPLV